MSNIVVIKRTIKSDKLVKSKIITKIKINTRAIIIIKARAKKIRNLVNIKIK